jgi:hypothetical protein
MATWKGGAQGFPTQAEAMAAARSMKGTVLVHEMPAGSVAVFRDGRELEGIEASEATQLFMSPTPDCEQPGCIQQGVDEVRDLSASGRGRIVHLCQEHADEFLRKQHADSFHKEILESCPLCRPALDSPSR